MVAGGVERGCCCCCCKHSCCYMLPAVASAPALIALSAWLLPGRLPPCPLPVYMSATAALLVGSAAAAALLFV